MMSHCLAQENTCCAHIAIARLVEELAQLADTSMAAQGGAVGSAGWSWCFLLCGPTTCHLLFPGHDSLSFVFSL